MSRLTGSVALLLTLVSTACMDAVPEDAQPEEVSTSEQELLPTGGVVRIAVVPYRYTDSDPTEIRAVSGAGSLQELAFTGTGRDAATGSLSSFFSSVSSGRITVEGTVYPWINVVALHAPTRDDRAFWRPMDVWYNGSEFPQVANHDCGAYAWGATPEKENKSKILAGTPDLFLCRDPEGDANHFWSRDGIAAFSNGQACPRHKDWPNVPDSTAAAPPAGVFFCIHRSLGDIDRVNRAWSFGALPEAGIDHNGVAVTTAYNPADWMSTHEVTLYGFPTRNVGQAQGAHRAYVPLARSDRSAVLHNLVHETGHTQGLGHAASLRCTNGAGTTIPFDRNAANCSIGQGYGPNNFMGAPASVQYGDGYSMLALGAIAPSNLTTIASSGGFPLPAIASSTPKVLRVATGIAANTMPWFPLGQGPAYYYLDHRAAVANTFDSTTHPGFEGIEVKIAPDFASEQTRCLGEGACTNALLLDLHPETAGGNFGDATLGSGESFTDRAGKITMQATLGASPYVDVTFTPNTTKLIFTTIGGGSGYMRRQNDGNLVAVQTVNGFSAWSHIAGTNNSGVIFYNAGLLWKAHLDANGMFQSQGAISGTPLNFAGWTSIAPVGRNNLIFYNSTTGIARVAAMGDRASSFAVKPEVSVGGGYTAFVGSLNGSYVKYRASNGALSWGTIDGNGTIQSAGSTTIGTGFTKVTEVREDAFAFYNPTTGVVQIIQVNDQRVMSQQGNATIATGSTDVAGGIGGHLLFYRASDGRTLLGNVTPNYNVVLVGAVPGPGANLLVAAAGGDTLTPAPPAIPGIPNLTVGFTQCVSGAPRYLIDWSGTGAALIARFEVDVRIGIAGAWVNRYNDLTTSMQFNSSPNSNDAVRVRACNGNGCSLFRQAAMNVNCNGNNPPHAP